MKILLTELFLLFKTEVFRSPGALISHMQMLDLISYGKMRFQEAFEGNQMPLSSSGIIKPARELNDWYNKQGNLFFYYFSNPFSYGVKKEYTFDNTWGDIQNQFNPRELMQKEAALMDRWLRHKWESQGIKEEEITQKLSNPQNHIPETSEMLNGLINNWQQNPQRYFKANKRVKRSSTEINLGKLSLEDTGELFNKEEYDPEPNGSAPVITTSKKEEQSDKKETWVEKTGKGKGTPKTIIGR